MNIFFKGLQISSTSEQADGSLFGRKLNIFLSQTLLSRKLAPITFEIVQKAANDPENQCGGSGSGIQCLFDPWIRDPGWVKNQDLDPG